MKPFNKICPSGNTLIDCDIEYAQRDAIEQAKDDAEYEPDEDNGNETRNEPRR